MGLPEGTNPRCVGVLLDISIGTARTSEVRARAPSPSFLKSGAPLVCGPVTLEMGANTPGVVPRFLTTENEKSHELVWANGGIPFPHCASFFTRLSLKKVVECQLPSLPV